MPMETEMDNIKTKRTLLIAGFEPVGPFKENPSWTAAAEAGNRLVGSVVAPQLPVDYLESRRPEKGS